MVLVKHHVDHGEWFATIDGVQGILNPNESKSVQSSAAYLDTFCNSRYVDIGSSTGCTAFIVAKSCNALVYSHHTWPFQCDTPYVDFVRHIDRMSLNRCMIPVRGEYQETLDIHRPQSIHVAFAHGEQVIESTELIIHKLVPKMHPDGYILWKDCFTNSAVMQALVAACYTNHLTYTRADDLVKIVITT